MKKNTKKNTKRTGFILAVFVFLILSFSIAWAIDVDLGCPSSIDFVQNGIIECNVKNPDTTLGINLMSLTIDSVSGGASLDKLEPLVGNLKLFSDDPKKSGFVATAEKDTSVFKITLKMDSAGNILITLKDVVVKTGDDIIYKSADDQITFLNNQITISTPSGECTDTDGGKSYSMKGTVSIDGQQHIDSCTDDILTEYSCSEDGLETESYNCKDAGENYACKEGQCICTPACDGKECGPDGCGGNCGECAGTCQNGACVQQSTQTLGQLIDKELGENKTTKSWTPTLISTIANILKEWFTGG